MLGAVGVIYGDIGTSPLYAIKQAFNGDNALPGDEMHVFGLLSLVFWALIIVVSIKYTTLMMRADNKGQGGSLALLALVLQVVSESRLKVLTPLAIVLGVAAGALFYGDSMITPAISVLSAVEGLEVALPELHTFVIPATLVILVLLFLMQSRGTHHIGRLFGPVMCVWFVTIAALGIWNIIKAPEIIAALSPFYAAQFFVLHPMGAFLSLAAVILAVTGGETLYADMGHFGKRPVRLAWFSFVLPCLTL
ncbi:MAG: KUP/HAK/KT family potassium transporter, partial [Prosthecobacter sp.]|nr:KUP/HAK/KT family potassium transporter [Prosthecobacter sp.]